MIENNYRYVDFINTNTYYLYKETLESNGEFLKKYNKHVIIYQVNIG